MDQEIQDLTDNFQKLKEEYSKKREEKILSNFYDLSLKLDLLSLDELMLVHVKLHNAIYYKNPFTEFKKIKEFHDKVVEFLPNHQNFDILD